MKKNLLKLVSVSSAAFLFPVVAFAQPVILCIGKGFIPKILCPIKDILNVIVPILIALGVVYFVWGVVMYVIASDEEAKKSGKDRMIYGLIGFAVIIGLWGLVTIIVDTFRINPNSVYIEDILPF